MLQHKKPLNTHFYSNQIQSIYDKMMQQTLLFWQLYNAYGITKASDYLASKTADVEVAYNFNETTMLSVLQQLDFLSLQLADLNAGCDNRFVQFLLKQTACPLQLSLANSKVNKVNKFFRFQAYQRHRSFVVNTSEMHEQLNANNITRSGITISIFQEEPNLDELSIIAERLWHESGIYKIYYITPSENFFYNPFAYNETNKKFGQFISMLIMNMDDIFLNMHKYAIRTYIFDSVYSTVFGDPETKHITSMKGTDVKIAQLLSKILNFTMALQWPDDEFFGARLENGSYNGAIGRMVRYETDVTLAGFFVKDYLTRDMEFSVSVYMDELCCYVMKAKRIPQSILPLFAVDIDIWFSFLLFGLFSPFIWMAIRRLNLLLGIALLHNSKHLSSKHTYQYIRIFIDTWVVWVRVNIVRFPPFYSERIFVISLCLVSVIFGALFESSLATVFIRPLYYKDINTMRELDAAHLRIYIKHAAMKDDLFYGHSSAVYQHLNRKLLLVAETEERLISMMSKRGGFAAVTRASSLELVDIRYFITKKLHKIPECPKNYHIAFLYCKQTPYGRAIDIMLLKFLAAGLVDHWIDEEKQQAKISIYNFSDYMAELGHNWKVLTLSDLQLAFYALGTGCTLAAIVLVFEIVINLKFKIERFMRKKQQRRINKFKQ